MSVNDHVTESLILGSHSRIMEVQPKALDSIPEKNVNTPPEV